MNIYLLPYTSWRHIAVAIVTGGATTITWYLVIVWIVLLGPVFNGTFLYWSQSFEGLVFISALAATAAGTSIFAEGSLRRRTPPWRFGYTFLAAALAFGMSAGFFLLTRSLVPMLTSVTYTEMASDPSVVTLRYTVATWGAGGVASGLAPWFVRRMQRLLARTFGLGADGAHVPDALPWSRRFWELTIHLGGSISAALLAATVWHAFGHYPALGGDLYLASALGALTWGFVHGLLCWPIPDDLYAGWVRVLSAERYGLRIPIDHEDGKPAERFIGHFPRGLDLYVPAERGAAELHASFVVDDDHNYAVRGLTLQPTVVKRLMEQIRLDYDPRRPAPMETELQMGDRILIGTGDTQSEVEFIMLPKEER